MRRFRCAIWLCLAIGVLAQIGCSRAYWRRNADAVAYGLIREKTRLDGRWSVPRIDTIPSPLSRMYDPANPDFGPLPPDDPAANRYMHAMSDFGRIHGSRYWSKIGMSNSIENPAWVASLPRGPVDQVPIGASGEPAEMASLANPEPLPFWDRFAFEAMWNDSLVARAWDNAAGARQAMFESHGGDQPNPADPRSIAGAAPRVVNDHFAVFDSSGKAEDRFIAGSQTGTSGGAMRLDEQSLGTAHRAVAHSHVRGAQEDIDLAAYQEPHDGSPPKDPFADVLPQSEDELDGQADSEGMTAPPLLVVPERAYEGQPAELPEVSEEKEDPSVAAETGLAAANPALPAVENLSLDEAIALSYLHGRDYQTQIENLYIAALNVAFNRFQFDVRFFGINGGRPSDGLSYQGTPDGPQTLTNDLRVGMSRLLPAGGQWAVELANQTLWLFSNGPNESGTASTLTFSFLQPLLFAAGRKVVLESLTQAERDLLYAARDLARFRKVFFVNTVSGYLGLLQSIQNISNQVGNIRRLEQQLQVAEANVFISGPLAKTQIESTLLQALKRLRSSRRGLQDSLDQFKIQLGLPPDLKISLDTRFLVPFQLISQTITGLELELEDEFLAVWSGVAPQNPDLEGLRGAVGVLEQFAGRVASEAFAELERDFRRVEENLPRRLAEMPEPVDENRARVAENLEGDRANYVNVRKQLQEQTEFITALAERIEQLNAAEAPPTEEALKLAYTDTLGAYDKLLRLTRSLKGIQMGLRTELISLNPFEMPMTRAVGYALTNRLDLMNQRARVTDLRRKVEIAANALRAVVDVRVEQQFSTRPIFTSDNPFDFRRGAGTFRAGLSFVAPLSQIQQRNQYRISQITYQRARRAYMLQEDTIKFAVRSSWRQLWVLRKNFEVTRYALRIAVQQYDQAVEEAANPQQQSGGGGQSGLNVLRALSSVLGAQNSLISIWVNYESARLNIYRDMGIMNIDARGMWVDPFYQNGMQRPSGTVDGPPGWSGSAGTEPALFPESEPIVPIPPAPPAQTGVRIRRGGSALSQVFAVDSSRNSFPPSRDSTAARLAAPPRIIEAGHARNRRSHPRVPARYADRSRSSGIETVSGSSPE